jgi:hypothetical protein
MAFLAENIRDWHEQDVVDAAGEKVGTFEGVYFDAGVEEPAFATVRVGMRGRHRLVLVPLDGAKVSPTHVKVTAGKKLIKDAPAIAVGGELKPADEPAVFAHYGLSYRLTAGGERRLRR